MIEGIEWLFIAPRFARALAEARREYEKASSTFQEIVKEFESEMEKQAQRDQESIDRSIIEKARSLGIETYGKTKEEPLIAMFKKEMEKADAEDRGAQPPESRPEQAQSNEAPKDEPQKTASSGG